MKKINNAIIVSLISLLFTACASGSVLVTGTKRTPIPADKVIVYIEQPQKYETIGIVTASSDSGFTEQGNLDYAMTELKKQASKVGANGIIIQNVSSLNSIDITAKSISGKAIYVPK